MPPVSRGAAGARIRAQRRGVSQDTIVISGVEELDAKLRRIERREALRIGRKAVLAALRLCQRSIQSEIHPRVVQARSKGRRGPQFVRRVRPRTRIKRTIGYRFTRDTRRGKIEAKCGVHVGKKAAARNRAGYAWFAHFLALGTADRRRGRIGGFYRRAFKNTPPRDEQLSTGRVAGDDFVGRGFAKARAAMEHIMRSTVELELADYWSKR